MKELKEEYTANIAEWVASLNRYHTRIEDITAEVNQKIGDLNEAIQAFNNTLKNVRDFRDGIVQSMRDHFNDQSESWQNGEEGEAYSSWMEEWESCALDFLEVIPDVEVQDEASEIPTALEGMPSSP